MAGVLETLFAGDGSHPKDVAKAYQQLSRQLARDEGTAEEMAWRQNFDDAKMAGGSAGNAVIPPPMSELDRWGKQIDGLIKSGNPVLQKEGLSQLAAYKQRLTTESTLTPPAPSTAEKMAMAAGLQPGTQEFKDFIMKYAFKTQARGYQPTLTTVSDSKYMEVMPERKAEFISKFGRDSVGPGMLMEEVAPYTRTVDPKKVQEANSAHGLLREFEDQLFGSSGIMVGRQEGDVFTIYKNALGDTINMYTQDDPRIKTYQDSREGNVVGLAKALGESGNLAIQDVERAKTLLPNLMLPFPDSPEVARRKLAILKRVIDANDPSTPMSFTTFLDKAESAMANEGLLNNQQSTLSAPTQTNPSVTPGSGGVPPIPSQYGS